VDGNIVTNRDVALDAALCKHSTNDGPVSSGDGFDSHKAAVVAQDSRQLLDCLLLNFPARPVHVSHGMATLNVWVG